MSEHLRKRQKSPDLNKMNKKPKLECNYGEDCYRKNPDHFKEFNHPHLEKILANYKGTGDYDLPPNLQFQKQVVVQQLAILRDNHIYQTGSDSVKDKTLNTTSSTRNEAKSPRSKESDSAERKDSKNRMSSSSNVPSSSQPPSRGKPVSTSNPPEKQSDNQDKKPQSDSSDKRRKIEDFFSVVAPKGRMAAKLDAAAPYHMFFTTITAAPQTHNQALSITFQELLDPSLGKLESSLQINFMVDVGWLLAHYYFAGYNDKPLTILYGEDSEDLRAINKKKPNVKAHHVQMKNAFGKHHTKMSLLCYEDGSVRVVVSTANLYLDDWENRTQGLWLSPRCPRLSEPIDPLSGDSPTGCKRSLIDYLNTYAMPCLSPFVEKVRQANFSAINVFLVASVPGGHFDAQWGLARAGALLSKHCQIPSDETDKWDLITQASSIGSYGKEPKLWLTGDFQSALCRSSGLSPLQTRRSVLRFVYPSLRAVKHSHDDLLGGGCLPYSSTVHVKQTWLNGFMHEWSAKHSGRNKAMPHIKSYLRLSPDGKQAAFFILTSSNVSKSAWGVFNKGNGALRVNSYEAGVMFLPKFIISKDFFSVDLSDPQRLPVPYDLPPVPYTSDKIPWVQEYLQ